MPNEIDIAVHASTAEAKRDLTGLDKEVDDTATKATRHGTAMASLGKGIGLGLAGLAAGGIALGVKTAAANEQASISFTSLLGSADKAKGFLADLTTFAADTPFDLPGVEKAAQQLLGVGMEAKDVKPFLTAFGNTASALGLQTDQFNSIMTQTTQAMAQGKFQIGDLNQLASNGIPIYKLLGEAFHTSQAHIIEMANAGKLTTDKVLPALQSQMQKDYGGAMAAQSKTLTGEMSTLQDTLSQTLAKGVKPLVPAMGQLLGVISTLIGFLTSGTTAAHATLIVIAALAVAMMIAKVVTTAQAVATNLWTAATKIATAASKTWAAAQWLLNAAMEANPIGLVILAIIALVAIIVIAWKHSETFRVVVTGAFHAVLGAASGALSWIRSHWPLLLAILTGPFGIAVLMIARHWSSIRSGAQAAVSWVTSKFTSLIGFFTGMPGRIANAASGLFNGIKDAFRGAINDVIDIWNSLHFGVPGFSAFGHKVGGFDIGVPQIGHKASGGIGGGLTEVGERGRELLNLPQGTNVRSNSDTEQAYASGRHGGRTVLELHSDGSDLVELLLQMLRKAVRVRGGDVQLVLGR